MGAESGRLEPCRAASPDAALAGSLASAIPPGDKTAPRWLRWTGGLTALVLLPKCVLCVVSYLAVATGLMRAAPELCGATEGDRMDNLLLFALGSALGLAGWLLARARRGGVSASERFVR